MSGYFSATETAFSTINKTRLRTLADKGDKKADKTDSNTSSENSSSTPDESTDSSSEAQSFPSFDEYFGFESEILLPFQPFD